VVELELPGFGESPLNERTDGAASMADTAAEVIAALGAGPVHLWGTSMGGLIATHLAVRRPDAVRSLILEAPGAFRVDGRNPAGLSPGELSRALNTRPERVAWRTPRPPDPDRWRLVVRIMGPAHDAELEARLAEIAVPTLVMWGEDDGVFSPAGSTTYRDNVRHCAVALFADAAHDLQGDRPEACAELVRLFLADGLGFTAGHREIRVEPD